ncbi:MAG: hypothetical protein KBT11_08550 [Treponema sp.]|nr:hypothetical protein [Candidatus Treponema equifaecale]
MNIKKAFGCALFAFSALAASFALTVNRPEIESAGPVDTVVFRNYSGPHTVINTIDEIKAIGAKLGDSVKGSLEQPITAGSANKYSVIHAIDPSTNEKMDADIFIIGAGATVDHIKNVRRIISAYLSSAYGYSTKDSDAIATFVTVYNAVYRGNLKYFETKYKNVVINNLSASKVGMSTDYQEWPGNTQIIIPLSDVNGGLSTVDTSLISDRNVVKSLQEEDDKGVDVRKDMVDIKEREADNAAEKAQEAQKQAVQENEKLKEEQQKASDANKEAAKAQQDANKAQKEADEAKKKAEENPNDKQAQKEAETAQQAADEAQKQAEEKQEAAVEQNKAVEEQAEKVAEAQNEAAEAQNEADKKRTEAQEERTSIAKDQAELLREANENDGSNVMYGLINVDELGATSEIVKLNSTNGSVIKESPVTVIRGRTVYEDGEYFVAVAGTNFGNGTVKLVLIDKENLEIVTESKEQLSELSVLVEQGGNYFAVVQDGRDFYLAKFNNSAELSVKSPVKVKAATPITITSKGILVNTANGNPAILNADDLTLIGEGTVSNSNKAANIINGATQAVNAIDAK